MFPEFRECQFHCFCCQKTKLTFPRHTRWELKVGNRSRFCPFPFLNLNSMNSEKNSSQFRDILSYEWTIHLYIWHDRNTLSTHSVNFFMWNKCFQIKSTFTVSEKVNLICFLTFLLLPVQNLIMVRKFALHKKICLVQICLIL